METRAAGLLEFAGGPLQTLFGTEQQGLLPVPTSGSFVPEGHLPDASQSSPV
ncbi:ZFAT isoform 2 [Pongo abelii]|uniref:ZFAT isoform 2 n=1 Tax=Pongo abelii TaxID=9601 RepID=A0A2J8SAB0_PONAB|nr:ZFAT isoform 2 [Pongo abelii]